MPAPPLTAMPLDYVPRTDRVLFYQYPKKAQTEVLTWIQRLIPARQAKRGRRALFEAIAQETGYAESKVRGAFYAWRNGGDFDGWHKLVDHAKYPLQRSNENCPPEFVDHWLSLLETRQRADCGKDAWNALVGQWKRWRAGSLDAKDRVPGFDEPPPADDRTGVPSGWGYANLMRLRRKDATFTSFGVKATRKGGQAADFELPPNLQTRVGVAYLEQIFADDHLFDVKVVKPFGSNGNARRMRPAGFFFMDRLTASFVGKAVMLQQWDDAADKTNTLRQAHYVWSVLDVLSRVGYRRGEIKTTWIDEHATASMPSWLADGLKASCGIQRETSRLFGDPVFRDMGVGYSGGMLGRGGAGGDPNRKALIEGAFRLVETRFQSLPGAVGPNERFTAKEEERSIDRYTSFLLRTFADAPAHIQQLVQFPDLKHGEFAVLCEYIFDAIDSSPDHDIEGWSESGFESVAYEFGQLGLISRQQLLALGETEREIVLANGRPKLIRLSRKEARQLCEEEQKKDIVRLKPWEISGLLPDEYAQRVRVGKKSLIRLRRDGERYYYIARHVHPQTGLQGTFPMGREFRAFLNPVNPSRLILTDFDGRYLASVDQFVPARAGDHEAIAVNWGRIQRVQRDLAEPVERRLESAGLPAARRAMVAGNEALAERMREAGGRREARDTETAERSDRAGAALDRFAPPAEARAIPAACNHDDDDDDWSPLNAFGV